MRVVAIGTVDQAFVYTVMKRPVELLLRFEMAAVAERRRLFFHQELRLFGMVRRVAIDTAHVVLQVRRAREVAVLLAKVVALQAALADLLRRSVLECEYLGFVAATLYVRSARAMAGFTSVPFRPVFFVQHGDVMRGILISLEEALARHVFMTCLAGLRANIVGRIAGIRSGCRRRRLGIGCGAGFRRRRVLCDGRSSNQGHRQTYQGKQLRVPVRSHVSSGAVVLSAQPCARL